MTIKEFILLTYLFHQQENTLPFKKIVSDLCYKQSDLVQHIKVLVKHSYISKVRSKIDERNTYISISEEQREKLQNVLHCLIKSLNNLTLQIKVNHR